MCTTSLPASSGARLDHLVVLARDLEQGAAWCRARLGVDPQPGGRHPLMGTHNLLLNVASAGFADAYLEIIAIDPQAQNLRPDSAKRWFDMDCSELQADVAAHGPRLIHFVARVPQIVSAVTALAALGIDRGAVLEAARGDLRWRISVRDDGQRLFDGALPTLIEWSGGSDAHPARRLPDSGLALRGLALRHPQAQALAAARRAIGLGPVSIEAGSAAGITALFDGPAGTIELRG